MFYFACISIGRVIEIRRDHKSNQNGSGRCMAVMDSDVCNLSSCKMQCFQVKNGNGVCLAKVQDGYQCVCFYNC